jgi:TatD DNase family protein
MDSAVVDKEITLVDTHAHLDFSQFDEDRELVLERAADEGVSCVVTVGFDLESSRQAVALADGHTNVKACVGVHPHDASTVTPEAMRDLKELSEDRQVVAIGEIGLDYYRDRSPRSTQRKVLREQLELAAEAGKPVVIHDREAHDDIMGMLREWSETVTASNGKLRPPLGVVHCFSGDQAMADELFELGFLISVAGPVTFNNARRLQDLVRRLPLDKLLVETDCPFLSPHPHRGQRNEPARVRLVASRVAEIRKVPLDEVARATTENARRLFRFG